MHFDLSDEQRAIAAALDALLEARLGDAKIVQKVDEPGLDRALWSDIHELELGGVLVPETLGGLQQDLLTLAVIAERLGAHAAPAPVIGNALAAWVIAEAGDGAQRERWLQPLMRGEKIAAFALAESGEAWLPATWTTGVPATCVKTTVEWGAEADLFIVGLEGGRLALVEAGPSATPKSLESLDRTRPVAEVRFESAAASVVSTNADFTLRVIDAMLVLLAADALGAASAAMDLAVAYAKQRVQFGQEIGKFQALKHQLADLAVEIEPSRPLVWYAAHAWDVYPDRRRRAAALVKAHVTDGAVLVARAATEAHGGLGYTWEYPIHILLKRAVFDRAFLGGPRLHRERMAELAGW